MKEKGNGNSLESVISTHTVAVLCHILPSTCNSAITSFHEISDHLVTNSPPSEVNCDVTFVFLSRRFLSYCFYAAFVKVKS